MSVSSTNQRKTTTAKHGEQLTVAD